LIKACFGPPR